MITIISITKEEGEEDEEEEEEEEEENAFSFNINNENFVINSVLKETFMKFDPYPLIRVTQEKTLSSESVNLRI